MEHVRAVGGWYMEDREVTIDSARVMDAIAAVSDPRSELLPTSCAARTCPPTS